MKEPPRAAHVDLKGCVVPLSKDDNSQLELVLGGRKYVVVFSSMKRLCAALAELGVPRHLWHTVNITDERKFLAAVPLCVDVMLDLHFEGGKRQFSVVDRTGVLN
jgi:hypothetical protein